MARYGQSFKDRVVARLLPPESATLELVSKEVGIAVDTLQRWRDGVQSMPALGRAWTEHHRANAVVFLFQRQPPWQPIPQPRFQAATTEQPPGP